MCAPLRNLLFCGVQDLSVEYIVVFCIALLSLWEVLHLDKGSGATYRYVGKSTARLSQLVDTHTYIYVNQNIGAFSLSPFRRVPLRGVIVSGAMPFGRVLNQHQQSALVETHLKDVPVVAHPGGKLNTNVAWSELDKVLFLVNGSRCMVTWAVQNASVTTAVVLVWSSTLLCP